jgi:hypothetical protein
MQEYPTSQNLTTSLPFSFYFSRIIYFGLGLLPLLFHFKSGWPIEVFVGTIMLAFFASWNKTEYVLEFDEGELRVIIPSFYGRALSSITTFERKEIRSISLSPWETHYSRDMRDNTNLEIIVEDKVIQERTRYRFPIVVMSRRSSPFWDNSNFSLVGILSLDGNRRKMFETFVEQVQKQITDTKTEVRTSSAIP